MAGMDDNVAIIGDWVPPSPTSRAFLLGDDISSRTVQDSSRENRTEELFLVAREQGTAGNVDKTDVAQTTGAQFTELAPFAEQKSSSRGRLVERMAARAGFNAPRLNTESIRSADLSLDPEIRFPYLTIPPGLSPTTLLGEDSPIFLSNSLAQPSPTTGKFAFVSSGKSSMLMSETADKSKDNFFRDMHASSFAFKPVPEPGSSFFLGATSKQSFPSIAVSVQSENSLHFQGLELAKVQSQNRSNTLQFPVDFSRATSEKDNGANSMRTERMAFDTVGGSAEHSPPLEEQQDEEGEQRVSGDSMGGGGNGTLSEDGYNWRKYGQKQVKGSEYPRSYYKCTHLNCLVKKKVERSHEGHITEIIYKGAHNHPKPPPNRRSAIGSLNPIMDMQLDVPEQAGLQSGMENGPVWGSQQKAGTPDWRLDNVEVTSSASVTPEFGNTSSAVQVQNGNQFESGDAVDVSSTFSNDEDEDDQATHGSVGYDGEGDESELKRRKIETYPTDIAGATRAIREPRVVVQTTSEVDILDDGYRWRKYGQKVVKGNPNPRSYYKCTNAGCTVRKHVERASHDLKSVITTYEGKHNHDVPAARNSSHVNSGASNTVNTQAGTAVQNHVQRPEPSQVHTSMGRFDRSGAYGSFGIHGRQQLGPTPGFSFGMNQHGLANLAMSGLGPGQPKMPVMSVPPYLPQQQTMNGIGFILPKGEPKVEPMSEPGLNLSSNPSMYQQMMNRLPLGPQM